MTLLHFVKGGGVPYRLNLLDAYIVRTGPESVDKNSMMSADVGFPSSQPSRIHLLGETDDSTVLCLLRALEISLLY